MLSALFDRPQNSINTSTWGVWPGDDVSGGSSARPVGRTEALQLMAVYGSVGLISDGISTLPVDVFNRVGDGRKEETAPPEWLGEPTPDLDIVAWCSQVLASLLLHGNCYLLVLRGRAGRVVSVTPLDPLRVTVDRQSSRKVYRVDGVVSSAEIVHLKGRMLPGSEVGLSPLEFAFRTIGLGLSALDYGMNFFDQDGNMPGVIELPTLAQPGTMENIAKQWRRKRQRGGRGLPGVLQAGAQWKPSGVTPDQAQFLATRQWSAAEIAGQVYLVDPSDLGIPTSGTSLDYKNIQDRNTRRVQVTFLPWIIRVEKALSSLLPVGQVAKFNVDGLLRGDQKARFDAYRVGIEAEFLTPNEARDFEDWAPLPTSQNTSTPRQLAEMIQKIYLGVGVVLSAEEARQILNDGGASLPPAVPLI